MLPTYYILKIQNIQIQFLRLIKFIQGHSAYWKLLEVKVMVPIHRPGANTNPVLEFLGKHQRPSVGANGQDTTQQSGAANDPLEIWSAPQSGLPLSSD